MSAARARIHAMFQLDEAAETELDARLDAYRAEVLAEQPTVCQTCGDRIVRFACTETGGGWMHDTPSDDPADGADHEAVPAAGEKATPTGATATPELTDRQAWLLARIRLVGGRWKTGRVTTHYRAHGFGAVRTDEARADLHALGAAGHLIRHDTPGVRWCSLNTAEDVRP